MQDGSLSYWYTHFCVHFPSDHSHMVSLPHASDSWEAVMLPITELLYLVHSRLQIRVVASYMHLSSVRHVSLYSYLQRHRVSQFFVCKSQHT